MTVKNRLRKLLRTKYLVALQNCVPEDATDYVRTKTFPMSEAEARRVLAGVLSAGVPVILAGGWAVSAIAGGRKRRHSDLDIIVAPADLAALESAFGELGYHCSVRDSIGGWWAPDVSVFRTHGGSRVEVLRMSDDHFDRLTAEGETLVGRPITERTTPGVIGGLTVPCLSAELQLAAHHGYENNRNQRADLARITAVIGA